MINSPHFNLHLIGKWWHLVPLIATPSSLLAKEHLGKE